MHSSRSYDSLENRPIMGLANANVNYYQSLDDNHPADNEINRNEGTPAVSEFTSSFNDSPLYVVKWCGLRRSHWLVFFYIIFYLLYLVFGAVVMSKIETPTEIELKHKLAERKETFLKKNPLVSRQDLESLLLDLTHEKLSPLESHLHVKKWSIGQAILYSVTLVTTIGYGHITPLTIAGKIFTLVYAIIGIPLTLLLFSVIIQRIKFPVIRVMNKVLCIDENLPQLSIGQKFRQFSFLASVLLIVFFIAPSIVLTTIEDTWNFLDGFYFALVSLTTIGLGDYIPGDEIIDPLWRAIYKCSIAVYLLAGLVCMSLLTELSYGVHQIDLGSHFHLNTDIKRRSSDVERELESSQLEG